MIINKYTKHSIFSLPQIFYDTFTKYDLKNDTLESLSANHYKLSLLDFCKINNKRYLFTIQKGQ